MEPTLTLQMLDDVIAQIKNNGQDVPILIFPKHELESMPDSIKKWFLELFNGNNHASQ